MNRLIWLTPMVAFIVAFFGGAVATALSWRPIAPYSVTVHAEADTPTFYVNADTECTEHTG